MFYNSALKSLDKNKAISTLKKFRLQTQHKTKNEIAEFIYQKIKTAKSSGNSDRLDTKYELDHQPVCRDSFCFAYDIKVYLVKRLLKLMRASESDEINSHKVLKWSDDHIHDFSLAESKEMFEIIPLVPEDEGEFVAPTGLKAAKDEYRSYIVLIGFYIYYSFLSEPLIFFYHRN
jgi:uncharacterized protein with WD repeat